MRSDPFRFPGVRVSTSFGAVAATLNLGNFLLFPHKPLRLFVR